MRKYSQMTSNARALVIAISMTIMAAVLALCPSISAAQSALPVQWVYTPIDAVQSVAYSPDGTMLAVGGQSGVQVFAASTGVLIRCLPTACDTSGQNFPFNTGVNSIAFSPDSKTLAVGGTFFINNSNGQYNIGELELWNISTGMLNASLATTSNVVTSVAFSPNGLMLADGGQTNPDTDNSNGQAVLELWNVKSGALINSLNPTNNSGLNDNGIVNSVAFSPDGTRLASGGANGSGVGLVFLWNLSNGTVGTSLATVATNGVTAVAFSPDGTTLADGGLSTDANSGQSVGVLELWNVSNSKLFGSLATSANAGVDSIAFSPNGAFLADGGANGNYFGVMEEWNVASGAQTTTFKTANRLVNSVAYSPKGTALADGGTQSFNPYQSGAAELWNLSSGTLTTLDTESNVGGANSVVLSPDGQTLTYVGNQKLPNATYASGSVQMWSVPNGTLMWTVPFDQSSGIANYASSVAYSPNGSILAVGGYGGSGNGNSVLQLLNASNGAVTQTLNSSLANGVTSVAFSPDGTMLADCGQGTTYSNGQYYSLVEIWNVSTGKLITSFETVAQTLTSVAFSPNGSILAVGGDSYDANDNPLGLLELWNVSTGVLASSLQTANSGGVASIAFSPDGTELADGGNALELWSIATNKLLSTLPLVSNSGSVDSVVFSPDGEVLFAGTNGNLQAFSALGYELLSYYNNSSTVQVGNFWTVTSVAVSTNGSVLAYGSQSGAIVVAANPFYDSVAISSFTISPQTVMGGTSSMGTVTLSKPAPPAGNGVIIVSGNTTVGVPGIVRIAPGATQATFTITTETLSNNTTATVSATSDGVTIRASVNVSNLSVGSLRVSPSTVQGGISSTGTITLSGPAPSGGISVGLLSNSTSAIVPATVTIAGGSTSATFTIKTSGVNTQTSTLITAGNGAAAKSSTLTITSATLVSIVLSPSTVVAGASTTGTVNLSGPTGPGGATVYLGSNSDAIVPSSVSIAQGQTSASFTMTALGANAQETDVIQAALSGHEESAKLTITPATLVLLSISPSILLGGNTSTGTVSMNGPAGVKGVAVDLESNNAAATVPKSVKIAAGQSEVSFTVKTVAVSSQKIATITAKAAAATKTASLTITGPTLLSLSLNPTTVAGGASTTGTVVLSSLAGAGGVVVKLSSNSSSATLPASVIIPVGKTSATFILKSKKVKSTTSATITGQFGNTSETATLTIS